SGMKVSSGSKVVVSGDFTNSGVADLGDGTIIFNGTAAQTIGGTTVSEFGNIEINNSAGVSLGVSSQVDGEMTLTDGVFSIGTNNLTFGVAASPVAGTLSSGEMILADGTGQVRKAFADGNGDPGAFIFTIGSDDGTAEYSPIEIDFNNSTFVSAYVAVNVTPLIEPDNSSIDNYLERYWTIVNSGITAYTYDITATYVDADIVGTEADISGALYDGTGWLIGDAVTTGSNTFLCDDFDDDGNATGVEFRIFSDLKIICQGAYNSTTNEMSTDLNGIIPLAAATAYAHIGYTGTESVGAIPSADIVDWILVEVRDAASAATATTPGDTVAGFLMKDGTIVATDGVSTLPFKTLITSNAYFVMIHRNHLSVMTASSPTESFGNYAYDFTDANNKAYGTNAQVQVDTSPVAYGLFAGETNLSGVITYADKQPIDDNLNTGGYQLGDTNFSGVVTYADKQFIDDNINVAGQVP
ncbi:MAG: hypothetical protein KAR09_04045, partial [Bacteroidales bacterium]|nr:hypothetical protein [Bacteroidales bacterium]